MSTTTLTAELPARRTSTLRRPRLINAELLKLRKRRGLVASGLALTLLPMIIAYTILLIVHATNSAKHGPAGGLRNFSDSVDLLTTLSVITAILIGSTLGAGDLGSGVFRELVVTGRSRLALFAARIPAGLALLWAFVGAGFAVTATASNVFAGSLQAPSGTLLVETAGWLALVSAMSLMVALAVSSVVGSRGTTIGIVFAWQIVVTPLLLQIKALGPLREGLLGAATDSLQPSALISGPTEVKMSLVAGAVVLLAWTIVALAFGAWRTVKRDA
jgi:ABC-type transport system involved in multi-copper enzyme maturation permease subunit